jgi:hypothetical protein
LNFLVTFNDTICVIDSDDKAAMRFLQNPEALKQKPWFMIRNILQSTSAALAANARTSPDFPRKK